MGQWVHQQSSTMYVNRGIKWWFIVCCPEKQTSKKHIWVGPIFVHSSHLLLCVDSKSSPGHTTVYNVTPIFPFSTKRPVGWPVFTTFTPFPSYLYQVRCTMFGSRPSIAIFCHTFLPTLPKCMPKGILPHFLCVCHVGSKCGLPKMWLEPNTHLSWSNLPNLRCGNLWQS